MELMMLFCQQKNLKYKALTIAFVFAGHCYLVWFFCLKTVMHHFVIPLSAPKSFVKITLHKSVRAVKKNSVPSKKSQSKTSVKAVQKKSESSDKKSVQKAVTQKTTHVPKNKDQNREKKNELKKTALKEVEKTVHTQEMISVKKLENESSITVIGQQTISESKTDQVVLSQQVAPAKSYYDVVYKTITDQWRPPIGIVKGTSCTVSFMIDQKGLPVDVVFEKKSGILMFDMSIKTVLARVNFSSLFVGHRFSIVFTV